MRNLKNFRFRVPILMFTVFLLISLACGQNATPEKVGNVEETKPEQPAQAAAPTEAPAQPAEAAPTDPPAQPTEPPPTDPPPVEEQTFNVGDIVSIGDSVLVVLGWEDVPGNDFSKPDEGKNSLPLMY